MKFSWPERLRPIVECYGVREPEKEVDVTRYEDVDLEDGLIIDITADQFYDYGYRVYVGNPDEFHQAFDFNEAHDYDGLNDGRLCDLYNTIAEYLL